MISLENFCCQHLKTLHLSTYIFICFEKGYLGLEHLSQEKKKEFFSFFFFFFEKERIHGYILLKSRQNYRYKDLMYWMKLQKM